MGRGIHSALPSNQSSRRRRRGRRPSVSGRRHSSRRRSSYASAIRTLRGLRYLYRLVTGKRMGFSVKGPGGMKLHFNSNGTLRSYSLKSFAGMRVVCNSKGEFKKLSLPGPVGSRVFVDSKGELAGFGLPGLLGGFLLYDKNGNLKRTYGPSIGGIRTSHDVDGTKRKHETRGKKRSAVMDSAARETIPETHKTFARKGEVTPEGIKPITPQDIERFEKQQIEKVKRETQKEITKEIQKAKEEMAAEASRTPIKANDSFSWDSSEPKEDWKVTQAERDNYQKQMAEFDKTVETSFADEDEVPFDDLF